MLKRMAEEVLTALGLTVLESAVLDLVLLRQEVSMPQIVEATGASSTAVSRAVSALQRQRLVDRVPGRRPAVLFLHADAVGAYATLMDHLTTAQADQRTALEVMGEQVAEGVARADERGRPYFERDPRPRGLTEMPRPSRRGRTQHDQVVRRSSLREWDGARSVPHCPARILVAGAVGGVDLSAMAQVQTATCDVRVTTEAHPEVYLLDRERIGVWASTREGWQLAWSSDASHVRAAQELFELWWGRAEPVRQSVRQ